jgi:hypothetical protein
MYEYQDEVGAIWDLPGKAMKSVAKLGKKAFRNPLGTVANLAPAVALGVTGGGLALLASKGAAEAARAAGVPKVATTAMDPSGAITHSVAHGAQSGFDKGGFMGALRGGAGGFAKGAHEVAKNPIIKATAAGLTFVMPPVGIALTGGLAATEQLAKRADTALAAADKLNEQVAKRADTALAAADKLTSAFHHGSAPVKKAIANIFARTAAAAKAGDTDAKRGLVVLAAAKAKLNALAKQTFYVSPNGKITKGAFHLLPAGQTGLVGYYVRADGLVQRGAFKRVA